MRWRKKANAKPNREKKIQNLNPQIKSINIILYECKFISATCASSEYEKIKLSVCSSLCGALETHFVQWNIGPELCAATKDLCVRGKSVWRFDEEQNQQQKSQKCITV